MASIANKTIKKSDNTTDIVWTGVNGSAGDKIPALYRSNTIGGTLSVRPEIRMSSRSTGAGELAVRRTSLELYYPEYFTIDSQQKVVNKCWGAFAFNAPAACADTLRAEAAYQFIHFLNAMKAEVYAGYPET